MADSPSTPSLPKDVVGPAEVIYEDFELPAETDLVSIIFVQPLTVFRYIRSTILSRAPDSIFAHHFGSGGVNEGKETLPDSYTVDRDAERFARFFDPWLRGLPTGAIEAWKTLDEEGLEAIIADMAFYGFGLSAELLPLESGSPKTLSDPPRVSFTGGTRMLKAVPPKWEQDSNGADIIRLPFIVETRNRYFFKLQRAIHHTRSIHRTYSRFKDAAEDAFWLQVRSLAPIDSQFRINHEIYKNGCESLLTSYHEEIETKEPLIFVEMRRLRNGEISVTVLYVDLATLEAPKDEKLRLILGRDDRSMFGKAFGLKRG